MIELTVLDYLEKNLTVPVRMEIPENPPDAFVLLQKTAGGETDHICTAMLAVQSYGPTLLAAAQLNEQVKDAMDGLSDLDEIARCKLNTDYEFNDMARKRYRYQAVYDIMHY